MQPNRNLPEHRIVERLRQLTTAPPETSEYNRWLYQSEIMQFMQDSVSDDEIILYASMRGVFIHAVFVPDASVDPPDQEDLKGWNCNPYDSWSIRNDGSPSPALADANSKTLAQGQQIVFGRGFSGVPGYEDYIELSQQFIHVLNVHYVRDRFAWCRLDRHGNIEKVVRLVAFEEPSSRPAGTIVLIKRDALARFLNPQELRLLRMFEFQLYKEPSYPMLWGNDIESKALCVDPYLFSNLTIDVGYASINRGIQVASIKDDEDEFATMEDRNVTFIARDIKSGVVREISPSSSAFRKDSMSLQPPYDLSPTFFRSEVLRKYKQDYDKYKFAERSIGCRGGWGLKTYDINEEGQVHTYLIYLWQLPFEEQLHWRQYNERPRGSISPRAYETDVLGNWFYEDANPLDELKNLLSILQCQWWIMRQKELLERVHYPVTDSTEEWKNELLLLDQLLIEGLNEEWLRGKAMELKVPVNNQVRSIRLVEACLVGMKRDPKEAKATLSSLHRLHNHRNKLAHASGESTRELTSAAISGFGTYNRHYTHMVEECLATFRYLNRVLV